MLFKLSLFVTLMSLYSWSQPSLLFSQFPKGETLQDSLIKLTVNPLPPLSTSVPDSLHLYYSKTPVGNILAGHTLRINNVTLNADANAISKTFNFTASAKDAITGSAQLPLGFAYVVAATSDGSLVTPEIPLLITTSQSATILTPQSIETNASPTFSWTPVPGVPAYHLLLSDQAIQIDPNKGVVSGASIIWQVITTKTSVAYGSPDPSGNFAKLNPPPLSPGVTYNFILLNNFDGRSALSSSTKTQTIKLFSLQSSISLSPPRNIFPTRGDTLNSVKDSLIRFQWGLTKNAQGKIIPANTYQVYVYASQKQNGLDVLIPVWQNEVTDTFVVFNAKQSLLNSRYTFKVFALGDNGSSTVGDTSSFFYQTNVQTLSLAAKGLNAIDDTTSLGDVKVQIIPIAGGTDPLPLFTVANETIDKSMTRGDYQLVFTKNGYLTQKRDVSLGASLVVVNQYMPLAQSQVSGVLEDASHLPLDNASILAKDNSGRTIQALSDANGFFLLGLSAGGYSLTLTKSDYNPRDTVINLLLGKKIDLGKLALSKIQSSLSGTVINDKGQAILNAQVDIKDASGKILRSVQTDIAGNFQLYLAPATYSVAVSKTGFSAAEKSIQVSGAQTLQFQLTAGASILKGRITKSSAISTTNISSGPLSGAQLQLRSLFNSTSQNMISDAQGGYSFSILDSGKYRLTVTWTGQASPESLDISFGSQRSTQNKDLQLHQWARIQGNVTLTPDTTVRTNNIIVSLLQQSTGALVGSTSPIRQDGVLQYILEGIPDGQYRLACGLQGYGLKSEPSVNITNGIWISNENLALEQSNHSLTFNLQRGAIAESGSIQLQSPLEIILQSGEKLFPAPTGTYTLVANPKNTYLIPPEKFQFQLPFTGPTDTVVNLSFPFSHAPLSLSFQFKKVSLELIASQKIDSGFLVFGYGNPKDTLRLTSALLNSMDSVRTISFNPGLQGGNLVYYFVIYAKGIRYANAASSRNFRAAVTPNPDLTTLHLDGGEILRLPRASHFDFHLNGFNAAGQSLDSALDSDLTSKISWGLNVGTSLSFTRRIGRRVSLSTANKSQSLSKKSATVIWDTLYVTAELRTSSVKMTIPILTVDARINLLRLNSSIGQATQIDRPENFTLFISAFDTTLKPPANLTPNPTYTLLPQEAGQIIEGEVQLNPNFIGPLRILANHQNPDGEIISTELGIERDALFRGLNVGQTVKSGDSSRSLFHDAGFEISLPDSALLGNSQGQLRIFQRKISNVFISEEKEVVTGPLYEISNPLGSNFSKKLRFRFGLPAWSEGRQSRLGIFDNLDLAWINYSDSALADINIFKKRSLSLPIYGYDGYYVGLRTPSLPLSVADFEIIPNPFSPLVLASRDGNTAYGTRIHFRAESNTSSQVTFSIKIYSLEGELMRILIEHQTVAKIPVDFYWDGKTDQGRWVRNGRYLVKLSLRETGGHKENYLVKPVVVFQ